VHFALTADQRELTEAAADFARRELNQNLAKRDDAGEFPRDAWRACTQFGVQGLPVPVEHGGSVADVLTAALVMEALGYGRQAENLDRQGGPRRSRPGACAVRGPLSPGRADATDT
jgi:alkylation response protein AidB-like acyl-CoA dehydrogenase